MRAVFSLAIVFFLTALISTAISQEDSRDYWIDKGFQCDCKGSGSVSLCDKAEAYFENALHASPPCTDEAPKGDQSCARAWFGKGEALIDNPRNYPEDIEIPINKSAYYEAIECFDRALEIVPEYAEAWIAKSESLSVLGKEETQESKIEEALYCSNRAIEIDPQNSDAWNSEGMAYFCEYFITGNKESPTKALDALDEAIRIDSCNTEALQNKAIVLSTMLRQSEADEYEARAASCN